MREEIIGNMRVGIEERRRKLRGSRFGLEGVREDFLFVYVFR